jgi:hypothetical protein
MANVHFTSWLPFVLQVVVLLSACASHPADVQSGAKGCGDAYYPIGSDGKRLPPGRVELRLCIGPDDQVQELAVTTTSGMPKMDQAAMMCLRAAQYHAGVHAGVPSASCRPVLVTFKPWSGGPTVAVAWQ